MHAWNRYKWRFKQLFLLFVWHNSNQEKEYEATLKDFHDRLTKSNNELNKIVSES